MQDCDLWALDRPTFRQVIASTAARVVHAKVTFLQSVPILSSLPQRHLYRVAEVSSIADFSDGAFIVEQDSVGSVFYIIMSGEVEVFKREGGLASPTAAATSAAASTPPPGDGVGGSGAPVVVVARLKAGSYFGEVRCVASGVAPAICYCACSMSCRVFTAHDVS